MYLYNLVKEYKQVVPIFQNTMQMSLYSNEWFDTEKQMIDFLKANNIPYRVRVQQDILQRNCTIQEADKWLVRQHIPEEQRKKIKLQKVSQLTSMVTIIDAMSNFSKFCITDFYVHQTVRNCKRCDERVKQYVITQHKDEKKFDEYKVIAKYCFHCGRKYFYKSDDRNIQRIQFFFKKAMQNKKVMIRQRGGRHLTEHEILYGEREEPIRRRRTLPDPYIIPSVNSDEVISFLERARRRGL